MPDRYYLPPGGGHVLIAGATGTKDEYGGKTVTANWWWRQSYAKGWHDLAVYINPKGHSNIGKAIDGTDPVTVDSLREFASAYREGERIFDYQLAWGNEVEAHEELIETLRELPGEKIVVHDEAQRYRDSRMLDWSLSQGGNLDEGSIRSLVITQRPWNLSETLRANMPVKIWVGPLTSEGRNYFQSENMHDAIPKIQEATGPFRWNVTDGGEYQHTNEPVPERYA